MVKTQHQHQKQQSISKKLASLLEKLCYWEKREQVEQKPLLLELKKVSTSNFKVGNLKIHYSDWEKITSDRIVPDIIKNGLKIDLMESPNITCSLKILHSELEKCIINAEIEKLLQKGVIIKCGREENNFASTVFTRDKKDGSFRTILSLKCLNKFVKYTHFKMESLKDIFKIIKEGVWMASVDLKDAFFTVPVHKSHQNYFKFEWFQGFYKFIGMPNGYTEATRIFTKILRPVFGYLRQEGYLLVIFVGDSYLQGNTESECLENIEVTVNLLIKLGFKIHEQNSILKPTQESEFLGFVINSKNMTFP